MQEESVQPRDPQEGEKSLEQLLAEAQAKMEQQREALMRALADAENARKRAQADAANSQKYAVERFAESLLPVVDSLEAALAAAPQESSDPLMQGVQVTLKQLLSALERARVTPIAAAPGERFDPYRHQAMASVEADAEPNTIVDVLQKGYHLHDRVLRPALVSVARQAAEKGHGGVENSGGNPISDT